MANAMEGKTVLVTGATDGIGRQTALELARMGAAVIVHARDLARGEAVAADIREKSGNTCVRFEQADFASLSQVRRLAENVAAHYERIDVLINNAGVHLGRRQVSEDGFEMTLAVNHLAHFLLTHLLLDRLKASAPSRVITVSSSAHQGGQLDFDDMQSLKRYDGYSVYSRSKLYNVMFSIELAGRLSGASVTSNSLHPGVVDTKMLRSAFPMTSGVGLSEGAENSIFLASAAEVAAVTGKYFRAKRVSTHSALADDPALRQRLWRISEQMVGIDH